MVWMSDGVHVAVTVPSYEHLVLEIELHLVTGSDDENLSCISNQKVNVKTTNKASAHSS